MMQYGGVRDDARITWANLLVLLPFACVGISSNSPL
jgi:hypothetical protein